MHLPAPALAAFHNRRTYRPDLPHGSDKMPELYRRARETETVERCVADYISGMSDRYAIELYKELFVPEVWRGKT